MTHLRRNILRFYWRETIFLIIRLFDNDSGRQR